jgi:predicted hydrocarbon binding protein
VVGLEEALGDKAAAIALITAGRKRGKQLAESIGLANGAASMSLEEITPKVSYALGKEGTRLCIIDKITHEGENYQVYTRESVCSAGEEQGANRICTYTMGAIQGFMESFLGKRLRGQQIASVLRDGTHDVFEYSVF